MFRSGDRGRLGAYTEGMQKIALFLAFIATPHLSYAASLQSWLRSLLVFLDTIFLPFLLAIAFLFFVFNVFRFFIWNGDSEEGREKAKGLALYGVLAFVIIVVFWGIVNLISRSVGLCGQDAPTADYINLKNNKALNTTVVRPCGNPAPTEPPGIDGLPGIY
jgi:predicted PurR-regulated permease PerM